MRSTLVGRDDVLERAVSALQATGRVLIEGPAGIGKTALLQSLVDAAAAGGMCVLRCAPTETETALPLCALADLMGPLAGDLEGLPGPQRHALRSALLLDDDPAPVDERALASAVRTVLDAAAARGPAGLLVAIDDVAWLDPPSARALQFALRRSTAGVRVAVARRSGEYVDSAVPLELDSAGPVERLCLPPLGTAALHGLLTERFEVPLSRPVTVRLARESGGNPLLAIELTRAVLRLPHLPGAGGDLPVPTSVAELVAASLSTLPPASVRAVRLAALLSAPRLSDLRAAGVAADALDAAEEVGLVSVEGGARVHFAHPVHATAIRATIPAGVRRRLHALLAEATADRDERARHLAQGTTEADDAVAAELRDAAQRVRDRGAPELAAEFYERAGAITVDAGTASLLRLQALHCVFESGNYRRAAEQADLLALSLSGDLLAEAQLLRAAVAFGADDLPLAVATAEAALDAATPASRLAGRIHAHLAVFNDAAGPARHHAEAALAILAPVGSAMAVGGVGAPGVGAPGVGAPGVGAPGVGAPGVGAPGVGAPGVGAPGVGAPGVGAPGVGALGRTDRALLASALMLLFLNEVRSGLAPRLELLDRGLALEAGSPSSLAGTVPAIWWKGTDQQGRARARLQKTLDAACKAGDEPLQHELMEHLAEAETLAGRYDRAETWLAGARELAVQLGAGDAAGRWLAGTLAALRGRLDEADAAAAAGLAEAAASDDPWLRRISLQLRAFVALTDGRCSDAAAAYSSLAEAIDATGLAEALASRFEPDWLEACVGIGDLTTAERVLDRLTRRHDALPRPWTMLALARSKLLLASAGGHETAPLIESVLAARDTVPPDVLPLDRARCLVVVGLAHRRARRKRAARDALLAAAAEFDAIGAPGFAVRARAEAGRTGARVDRPDQLSQSELRVAELAATGATNRQIAAALFISPKTAEANLARIYRKLAITRRVELPAALHDRRAGQI